MLSEREWNEEGEPQKKYHRCKLNVMHVNSCRSFFFCCCRNEEEKTNKKIFENMKENENEIGTEFSFKKGGGQGVVKLKLMRTKTTMGD